LTIVPGVRATERDGDVALPDRARQTAGMADETIEALADEWLRVILQSEPLDASLMGYREYDAHVSDLTRQHEVQTTERFHELRARAETLQLTDANKEITRAVLLALDDAASDSLVVEALDYTVTAFPVSPASILIAYLRMLVLTSPEECEAYLIRLQEIPRYLQQATERLASGRSRGLVPVQRLVRAHMDQINEWVVVEPHPLAIDGVGFDPGDEWRERRDRIIATDVLPAFRRYANVLDTEALPESRPDERPGLSHLPDGRERYAALVRLHTTTNRTPEELHEQGMELLTAIHSEFRLLGEQLFGTSDVSEIFEHLQEDPDLRWNSAEEIISAAEDTVRRAEAAASTWFGRVPKAVCALETIPAAESEGSAPAYYMPPSLDGTRPGTYYSNVNRPTERTRFDVESIAFHEAVPGHHFQISLAQENGDLPELRRLPMFTAYVEGWGLYAERLADEMGLYSSVEQRMGMLSADAWRAARLVVDTGIHHHGWSREEAVSFMRSNTPVAPLDVESEVDRYIAYPGQALSYMTGRLEISRLRSAAQSALGDRFDVREFHDVVLVNGALPLSLLDRVVTAWVTQQFAD